MSSFDVATIVGVPSLDLEHDRVSAQLKSVLTFDDSPLNTAMTYLADVGSKRLRSSLLMTVVASCNHPIDDTTIAACTSLELVHLSSLIHDDILDRSDTRWGKPTFNARHGNDRAIVAGDYLFAHACEYATKTNQTIGQIIAESISRICLGEDYELVDENNLDRSGEALIKAIKGKTASLVSTACRLGGICAELSSSQIKTLGAYGEAFGVSFQLIDDILDLLADPKLLGKPTWVDLNDGVYTMPVILALKDDGSTQLRKWLKDDPKKHGQQIAEHLIKGGYVKQSLDVIREYNQLAKDALSELTKPDLSGLAKLPEQYFDWALNNLINKQYLADIM